LRWDIAMTLYIVLSVGLEVFWELSLKIESYSSSLPADEALRKKIDIGQSLGMNFLPRFPSFGGRRRRSMLDVGLFDWQN
jgi:hypothetical protein